MLMFADRRWETRMPLVERWRTLYRELHAAEPPPLLEKYRSRWELMGGFEAAPAFRFGGVPDDEAEASMRLFAREVLPELKSWT